MLRQENDSHKLKLLANYMEAINSQNTPLKVTQFDNGLKPRLEKCLGENIMNTCYRSELIPPGRSTINNIKD